jgi:hypothetical protein
MKSIIQEHKLCIKTNSPTFLHKHHIFGGANRKLSEQYGLWVWLRGDWHNLSDYGVHFNKEFDTELKQIAQRKFEETHTRQEFMSIFGKNYL